MTLNYDNYDEYNPFILFVGHLYPYKQIPEMLRAFCNANELHENKYTLLIAGDNPIKKYYELIKSTISNSPLLEGLTFFAIFTTSFG